jgi:hypothetical protein
VGRSPGHRSHLSAHGKRALTQLQSLPRRDLAQRFCSNAAATLRVGFLQKGALGGIPNPNRRLSRRNQVGMIGGSLRHAASQPSPFLRLPSSQVSPSMSCSTMSPQRGANVQSMLQPP